MCYHPAQFDLIQKFYSAEWIGQHFIFNLCPIPCERKRKKRKAVFADSSRCTGMGEVLSSKGCDDGSGMPERERDPMVSLRSELVLGDGTDDSTPSSDSGQKG
jgi:hypothetical protein